MTVTADQAEAARQALYRYARAVDACDEAALTDCLHPEAVLHRVDGAREGRDEIIAFYRTVFTGPTQWSQHSVDTITCTPRDGGIDVDAYFRAVAQTATGASLIFGEYHDRLTPDADGTLRLITKNIDVQQSFPLEVAR